MTESNNINANEQSLLAEIEKLKQENEELSSSSFKSQLEIDKLTKKVTNLENRFGLVWPKQPEYFVKVVDNTTLVFKNKLWTKVGVVTTASGKNQTGQLTENPLEDITLVRGNDAFIFTIKQTSEEVLCHSNSIYKVYKEYIGKYLPILVPKVIDGKEVGFDDKSGERKHVLIEGDNYHALQVLQHTHRGKVDVIYIDVPYNTGNKDFKYNDDFVKTEDGNRHSSWLSFIYKRIMLAKSLLSENGIITVSIDENEQPRLLLLLETIFGESNIIGCLPTIMNMKGNQDQFGFAGTHEFTIFASNNKNSCRINKLPIKDSVELAKWTKDKKGYYKKGRGLLSTGHNNTRDDRPFMYFPVLIKDDNVSLIDTSEYRKIYNSDKKTFNDIFIDELRAKYEALGYFFLLPISPDGDKLRWDWGFEGKFEKEKNEIIVSKNKNKSFTLNKKQRPDGGLVPSSKQKSLLYKPEYSSGNGTNEIKSLFGKRIEITPKPLELIKDISLLISKKDSVVLDFFAGSGTTGHAVWELNKEDGGNRQVILVTNNESNICEEVTYERLRRCNLPEHGDYQEGLQYLQIKHISETDMKRADKKSQADHIKHIINLKYNASKAIEDNEKWYITDTVAVLKDIVYADAFFELCKNNTIFALIDNKSTNYNIFTRCATSYGVSIEKLKWLSKDYIRDVLTQASEEE